MSSLTFATQRAFDAFFGGKKRHKLRKCKGKKSAKDKERLAWQIKNKWANQVDYAVNVCKTAYDTSGVCTVVDNVMSTTPISALKALIKAPPTATIQFSPAFTSNFGATLADDRTLASCGVLDGDVLYYASGEPAAPAVEAAPKKKK